MMRIKMGLLRLTLGVIAWLPLLAEADGRLLYRADFEAPEYVEGVSISHARGWTFAFGGYGRRIAAADPDNPVGDQYLEAVRRSADNASGDRGLLWTIPGDSFAEQRVGKVCLRFFVKTVDWTTTADSYLFIGVNDDWGRGWGSNGRWLARATLRGDGTLHIRSDGANQQVASNLVVGTWVEVDLAVDLDNRTWSLTWDDVLVADQVALADTAAESVFPGLNFEEQNAGLSLGGFLLDGLEIRQTGFPEAENRVSVTDFGAVADGVTDNHGAFRDALAALAARPPGTVLEIPEASDPYLVTDTIEVTFSDVTIIGTGATVMMGDNAIPHGSSRHVWFVHGTEEQSVTNVQMRGLTIDANRWNNHGSGRGIQVKWARQVLLEQLHITRPWVGLSMGLGTQDSEARDVLVTRWHNDAYSIDGGGYDGLTRDIRMVRCFAFNSPDGHAGGWSGRRDNAFEIEDGCHNVEIIDAVVAHAGGNAFGIRNHGQPRPIDTRNIQLIRCRAFNIPSALYAQSVNPSNRVSALSIVDSDLRPGVRIRGVAESVSISGSQLGRFEMGWGSSIPLSSTMVVDSEMDTLRLYAGSVTPSEVPVDFSQSTVHQRTAVIGDAGWSCILAQQMGGDGEPIAGKVHYLEDLFEVNNNQGLATDGTHIYEIRSFEINKRLLDGTLVLRQEDMQLIRGGIESSSNGGGFFHAGYLYVASGTYQLDGKAYVFKIDPDTLTGVAVRDLTEHFSYGINAIVNWNGLWFIGETACAENPEAAVHVFDADFNHIRQAFTPGFNMACGWQCGTVYQNRIYLNDHVDRIWAFRVNDDLTLTELYRYRTTERSYEGLAYNEQANEWYIFAARGQPRIVRMCLEEMFTQP